MNKRQKVSYAFSLIWRGREKILVVDLIDFSETNKEKSEHFQERLTLEHISEEDLEQLRSSNIPCFIYKKGKRYYYTRINHEYEFTKEHLSNGLVDSSEVKTYTRKKKIPYRKHLDYPWLLDGFETINTVFDIDYILRRSDTKTVSKKENNFEIIDNSLYRRQVTKTYEISMCYIIKHGTWKTVPSTNERSLIGEERSEAEKIMELKKITSDQLLQLRKSGIAGFVLKRDNHLYYSSYSEVPKALNLGEHLCSSGGSQVCARLSAALDEEGGCEKVRQKATNIENFAFITNGYETFNNPTDNVFIVLECMNCETN